MISFLLHKMWNNKWMILSLLIGNILLIGIVSSVPMYVNASLHRVLIRDMQQFQHERWRFPAIAEFSFSFNEAIPAQSYEFYLDTKNRVIPEIIGLLEVPMISIVQHIEFEGWSLEPVLRRDRFPRIRALRLSAYENFEAHVVITHGRLPSATLQEGKVIEAIVNRNTMTREDLLLNELYNVLNVQYDDYDLQIKIVGIFEGTKGGNRYWDRNPNFFLNTLLVSPDLINNYFIDQYARHQQQYIATSTWFMMLDYNEMFIDRVPYYLWADGQIRSLFQGARFWSYNENFTGTLSVFIRRAEQLRITLWILLVPLYILLAFFIFMISKQILLIEQNDISVLKSRGASRGQLIGAYAIQSTFVAVISLALGIPLGVLIVRILGASNGFLEMVQRTALRVRITPDAILFSLLAVFLSILTMLIPVIQFSKITIVDFKRDRTGAAKKPLWQRFFLDIICLVVAGYGLFSFNNQQALMAMAGAELQGVDPLLFLSSSFFIIGSGLLCLRLFPYVMKLVFNFGRSRWSPVLYAAMLKVVRSSGEAQFVMIFLLFTVALGIFSAQSARTLNLNREHTVMYQAGASLTFQEFWHSNKPSESALREGRAEMPDPVIYQEPDFERFTHFQEVDSVTKVKQRQVGVTRGGISVDGVQLMAIDTQGFGNTVWSRGDLLPIHINHFLNTLAMRSDAVLLSDNFRTQLGFAIGDGIIYQDGYGNRAHGIVHGFVEYWPGYTPVVWEREFVWDWHNRVGGMIQRDVYLVVANLGHLQTIWRVMPYEVWMHTNTDTNNFFYNFIETQGLNLVSLNDTYVTLIESRNDPILQGTKGILTVSFITTLLICFTGFLIYWITSIKARVLQFGVFRAMGLSMQDIIRLLINEQLFITLTAVLIGTGVGRLASWLFVPLIQYAYSAADQVIPLLIVIYRQDYLNIYGTVGMMITLCLIILGVIISKIRIDQALKLGED